MSEFHKGQKVRYYLHTSPTSGERHGHVVEVHKGARGVWIEVTDDSQPARKYKTRAGLVHAV